MKNPILRLLTLGLLAVASGCSAPSSTQLPVGVASPDGKPESRDLYEVFQEPGKNYRPFVRWWWNGARQTDAEIERELDLLDAAGIGGVEINTIALPREADTLGYPAWPWLSDEWLDRVQTAIEGCRKRGMTADIIVGSGWPYGAEFLTRDQQLQMITLETFDLKGGEIFSMPRQAILDKVQPKIHSVYENPLKELVYLRLMPAHIDEFTPGISYDNLSGNETIELQAPADGDYVLYCLVKMTGYMGVIHGAPGAKGPVVNHFDRSAVEAFLERMSDRMNTRFQQMGGGNLRGAFTDSFELEGANWDGQMLSEFQKRRGYDLSPYLPYLIFKVGEMGNPVNEKYGSEISPALSASLIDRVRYDFDLTQRELFQEAFMEPYNEWCHRNGMLSRIQAYGRGLHPLHASMYVDIPECETWLGVPGLDNFRERGLGGHGYTISNKLVASASLLSGNGRVSCEEITNTGSVFNASLESMKIVGDLSNLSGVNHSIFHGFSYSPQEAPFPGWLRYGTYINERNTWWPYLRLWTGYKARLSAVFQNSEQQADIALMLPFEDLWSKLGAQRDPFPTVAYPDYAFAVWPALHQNGYGCDYISQEILQQGRSSKGALHYGTRSYNTLLLVEVESVHPATAKALEAFLKAGGRVVCIGKTPCQSVGLRDAAQNDERVQKTMKAIREKYAERFVTVPAPGADESLFSYVAGLQKSGALGTPYVQIDRPDLYFSQNFYKAAERDIFFFTNYSPTENRQVHIDFTAAGVSGKPAWLWDAETGKRYRLGDAARGLDLYFAPAESKLIVFGDADAEGEAFREPPHGRTPVLQAAGPWELSCHNPVAGTDYRTRLSALTDLSALPQKELNAFGGTLDYTATIRVDDPSALEWIDAGLTHDGVTEVILNGESLGVKWYGDRIFPLGSALRQGDNTLTVRVTTTLGNYCKSLKKNETAQSWTAHQPVYPMGLAGPVVFY